MLIPPPMWRNLSFTRINITSSHSYRSLVGWFVGNSHVVEVGTNKRPGWTVTCSRTRSSSSIANSKPILNFSLATNGRVVSEEVMGTNYGNSRRRSRTEEYSNAL
ncbi:hypothetical protein TRVL_00188 [Trypanosoma vivax]|nr:hypothetical protein TRVL_00188 [Trypanosoma vivax]